MRPVFFFVNSLDSGGIENYLLRFLKYNNHSFYPVVICKSNKFGELFDKYNDLNNIKLVRLKLTGFNLTHHVKLIKLFIQLKPICVCDFSGNFAANTMIFAWMLGVQKRISFYRNASNRYKLSKIKNRINLCLRYLTVKFSTRLLFNSKAALDFHFYKFELNKSKFAVVYNGVDKSEFNLNESKEILRNKYNLSPDWFIVGHTGRYNASKNHLAILEIASLFVDSYPSIKFLLVGKGTEELLNHPLYKLNHLNRNIFCMGYRTDIPSLLGVMDLFLFPSITEGQPNSLIEAMISGLPVVTSNIESIREIIPEYYHDRLYAPNNITGFYNEILNAYQKKDFMQLKDYAVNNFNHKIQFELFSSYL